MEQRTVDTTHLLGKHDGRSRESTSSNSRNGEQLSESRDVGFALNNFVLLGELDMGVVKISGGNDLTMSEPLEGGEGLLVSTLLHEPSRGLGAEEDEDGERDSGNESRTELKSPSDISNVLDNGIGTGW
jgi:hypothetical protein